MKNTFRFLSAFLLMLMAMSCGNDYYSIDDFATVKKIDTHMHLNADLLGLTEQAKADNFKLLSVNVDVPAYPSLDEQKKHAQFQISHYPDVVNFLTAFTLTEFDSSNWADKTIDKLKTSFSEGALGIKLWKNIGMVYKDSAGQFIMVDNPGLDPVINYIISQDKTVMGHIGEPKNCWLPLEKMTVKNDYNYFKNHPEYHMFLHPEFPSYEDQINARDHFLERHPDMRFVGAHLGSLEWDTDELAKRLDRFPNMAVDMAERISHLQYQSKADREKVRNFMIKYQDRLIYATDSGIMPDSDETKTRERLHDTWLQDWKYFATDDTMTVEEIDGEFQGLKLPKEVMDKIFRLNAIHWFKIP